MPSSISNSDSELPMPLPTATTPDQRSDHGLIRPIPPQPWTRLAGLTVALLVVAVIGWEVACRQMGYERSFEDSPGLWAEQRRAVRPDSVVIIGASRALFDVNLDTFESGFGRRPIQLALVGSSPYPILDDLANDESFRGVVICGVTRGAYFGPPEPLFTMPLKSLDRYHRGTLAQRAGHFLSLPLDRAFAFLQQDDLSLAALLARLPIPNRPEALLPPKIPGFIHTMALDREGRMRPAVAQPGELQRAVQQIWLPLFTPPPPPPYVPADAFMAGVGAMFDERFRRSAEAVAKLRSRGARVVFVHFPSVPPLADLEEQFTPRAVFWDGLLEATGAPGIFHADHPELAGFDCPEWSHLTAEDAVEFTRALLPHLQAALAASP
jgi:hypothetical protein